MYLLTSDTLSSSINRGVNGLVLGLITVFLVLIVLIIIISLMQRFIGSRKKEISKPMPEVKNAVPDKQDNNDEIVAVIGAAIACMAQREGKKYKIISFRKHNI